MWGNILGNGGEPFMANAPIVHATPTRKHSAVATPLRTTRLNSWYATYSGEFADVCVEQPAATATAACGLRAPTTAGI